MEVAVFSLRMIRKTISTRRGKIRGILILREVVIIVTTELFNGQTIQSNGMACYVYLFSLTLGYFGLLIVFFIYS